MTQFTALPFPLYLAFSVAASIAPAAASASDITVQARASLAAGVGALMEVRVDGSVVGSTEVRSSAYTNFVFQAASTSGAGVVDVVFTNDATVSGTDRNLWVKSVTINGNSYTSTDTAMRYDMSFDAALTRMEERVDRMETRSYTTTEDPLIRLRTEQ